VFTALAEDYEKIIDTVINSSNRNYLLALNKKRRAMFTHKYEFDRGMPSDSVYLDNLLQQSVDHIRLIDKNYLDTAMTPVTLPYYSDGVRNRNLKRKHMLIYPDYMDGWFSWTYHSDLFFNFIDKHNCLGVIYFATRPWDDSFLDCKSK
jgi:hypothetical protein